MDSPIVIDTCRTRIDTRGYRTYLPKRRIVCCRVNGSKCLVQMPKEDKKLAREASTDNLDAF